MQSLSKSLRLSSSLREEVMGTNKQGIVSILGSDCERNKSASLRRTLSADMSSKKWLIQHGFSPIKKIASSEEFPTLSIQDSEEEEECKENEAPDRNDVWSSIQEDNKRNKNEEMEKPDQLDIWSSILSQKVREDSKSIPPPYVHPLVKRSLSSLSEKSLELCTESLGSETGSDGFSSYPPSETSGVEDEEHEVVSQQAEQLVSRGFDQEYPPVLKYKKSPPRSLPPPITSLSNHDGSSLHMRSRRDNGRLVLEAVSVPSQNNFHAQRQDGRLVLTFINHEPSYEEEKENNMEDLVEEFEGIEEEGKEIEEEAEKDAMDQAPKLSSRVINFHKLITMSKPMVLATKSPTWPKKFNEMVKFEEEVEVEKPTPLAQSLPPRPPAAAARRIPAPPAAVKAKPTTAAASLNAYEYYWRPKTMASPVDKINGHDHILSKIPMEIEQQKLLVLRGKKGDDLVPLLKGCKEPRRSILFWEPNCIATS
ncbi:protein FAF-like chloroplastic [Tripterygium wilfordii]|uniref:Protein FAF-like chloroplastic n=1 Tax=Tripterygium wilfordii TaxID=458696 RepID=A0A7J7DF26_TRIWF|nr:protein FAF-like, chloroplastic [Tripterygium wilfordii]KAF5744923.1 protein FAF-like chloroplastic [Tripterygium wilfordii]